MLKEYFYISIIKSNYSWNINPSIFFMSNFSNKNTNLQYQGTSRERRKAEGWIDTDSVFPDCLFMQLCLLCFPWLPLRNVDFPLLDMLDIPKISPGPTAWFGPIWAWNRCSWAWLVHNIILPRKPTCKPMVCHCQCSRWIFVGSVCFDSFVLLAQCLQSQNLSNIF